MLERCEKVIAAFLISSFFRYLSHLCVSAHQTTIKSQINCMFWKAKFNFTIHTQA